MLLSAESCDLNCVRRRSERRLKKTIRTLRKSINREQFHLHFAGADYELSKSLGQPAELPGHCGAGQVLVGRRCGEFDSLIQDTNYFKDQGKHHLARQTENIPLSNLFVFKAVLAPGVPHTRSRPVVMSLSS